VGKRRQETKSREKKLPPHGPQANGRERTTADRERAEPGRSPVWIETKRPVLRFVLLFAFLMGPFTLFFYGFLTSATVFESYLHLNTAVSAKILRVFGEDAAADGTSLRSSRASLEIRHGCDAILPTALFVSAVVAFPVSIRSKWSAIFLGSGTLLTINLVRIISLYYTRIYYPKWFHPMHVDVWQPLFIFLALFLWVVWALRATRVPTVQDDRSM